MCTEGTPRKGLQQIGDDVGWILRCVLQGQLHAVLSIMGLGHGASRAPRCQRQDIRQIS